MDKLKLLIELEYDADLMYGDDKESKDWFFNKVLKDDLVLHSNEIGDEVGTVNVLDIRKDSLDGLLENPRIITRKEISLDELEEIKLIISNINCGNYQDGDIALYDICGEKEIDDAVKVIKAHLERKQ